MRHSSNNPKRNLASTLRNSHIDERLATYRMCIIYTDTLQDGSKSQGYIHSVGRDRRPAAWVVPIDIWEGRNNRGGTNSEPFDTDIESKVKFAREHVRLVRISGPALGAREIISNYLVRVPEPYTTSSSGELVLKAGIFPSQNAVPDGKSKAELDREAKTSGGDPKVIAEAMRSRKIDGAAAITIVDGLYSKDEQFPKEGDKWE